MATTTEMYTLSLHDALPISRVPFGPGTLLHRRGRGRDRAPGRSEEHTSELQSLRHLVCRLLLEKKKTISTIFDLDETNGVHYHSMNYIDGQNMRQLCKSSLH